MKSSPVERLPGISWRAYDVQTRIPAGRRTRRGFGSSRFGEIAFYDRGPVVYRAHGAAGEASRDFEGDRGDRLQRDRSDTGGRGADVVRSEADEAEAGQ